MGLLYLSGEKGRWLIYWLIYFYINIYIYLSRNKLLVINDISNDNLSADNKIKRDLKI